MRQMWTTDFGIEGAGREVGLLGVDAAVAGFSSRPPH